MFKADELRRRLADSFENNRSFPLISKGTLLNGSKENRYEIGLITPPYRPKTFGMDKIRGKHIF